MRDKLTSEIDPFWPQTQLVVTIAQALAACGEHALWRKERSPATSAARPAPAAPLGQRKALEEEKAR